MAAKGLRAGIDLHDRVRSEAAGIVEVKSDLIIGSDDAPALFATENGELRRVLN